MSTQTNGRLRKSLASQLDRHEEIIGRLEGTIDALADGLNQAVAMIVQESVTSAVQAAVVEVLSNSELHQRLRQGLKPDQSERPANPVIQAAKHLWGWLVAGVVHLGSTVASVVRTAWNKTAQFLGACKKSIPGKVASVAGKTRAVVRRGWTEALGVLRFLQPSRKLVLMAVIVGVTLAVCSYWCGPVVSSLVNGVVGFFAALAAGATKVMRGLVSREKLAAT
jgi:hypothetical protein